MEEKTYTKEQENILEKFFEEYHKRSHIHIGYTAVAKFFGALLVLGMLIPSQVYGQSGKTVAGCIILLGMVVSCCYISAYTNAYDGRGAVTRIDMYLEYLPISKKQLNMFRLKKLLRFMFTVYLVAQVGQVLFSLIVFHELVAGTLLYPIVCAFLVPFLVGAASVLVSK